MEAGAVVSGGGVGSGGDLALIAAVDHLASAR